MSNRSFLTLLVVLLSLFFVQTSYAITIVIDGIREAVWDTGAGAQLPGIQNDLNEGGITDGYDVEQVLWTNDTSNFYFLMQTYANTIWSGTTPPILVICIDTDNNTATGGTYANCNNMSGIDRSIVIDQGLTATSLDVLVLDSDPNTGNPLGTGTGARVNTVNEISVSLALLGLNSAAACTGPMPAVIYFNNGVVDPDDNTPDTGTFNLTCGSPTAVTMQNVETQAPLNNMNLLWLTMGLTLLTIGYLVWKKVTPAGV